MKIRINGEIIDGIKEVPQWISGGLTPESIQYAEDFGKWLAGQAINDGRLRRGQELTTTQFRNIYSEVVKIRMNEFTQKSEKSLLLLKPRMAYNMARQNKEGGKALNAVMQPALDSIFQGNDLKEKEKRFERFADLFEAILAYHRVFDKSY